MQRNAAIERLQRIADFRTTCHLLRKSGRKSIVLGVACLMLGTFQFRGDLGDYAFLAVASFELFVGLRNRYHPTAEGVLLDGVLLMVLGTWNVVNGAGFGFGMGLALAGVGVGQMTDYFRRVRAAFAEPPTDEQVEWLDEVIPEILAGDPTRDPDAVSFTAVLAWSGRFYGDTAIFVSEFDSQTLIAQKADVFLDLAGKSWLTGNRKASVRIGAKAFPDAQLSPASAANFERWKSEVILLEVDE